MLPIILSLKFKSTSAELHVCILNPPSSQWKEGTPCENLRMLIFLLWGVNQGFGLNVHVHDKRQLFLAVKVSFMDILEGIKICCH